MIQDNSLQTLWDQFLATWPLERIETMTLSEYVSTQDKTTFTYWLETKTQPLANIKGSPSPKFGIYKRNSDPKQRSGMLHGDEYSWWEKFGATEQQAFAKIRHKIIQVIKAARIGDVKRIDEVELAPIYKWKIAFMYQDQNAPCIINIFAKDKLVELTGLQSSAGYPQLYHALMQDYSVARHDNIAEYGRVCWTRLDNETTQSVDGIADDDSNSADERVNLGPLNQILYGPPGTGKTYHTIEAAVKAAEPDFYLELNIDHKVGATKEQRAALQSKYQELCDAKRIRFVTFHQSYGYEEFVEGLSASSTDGQVSYDVKDGIFKAICNDARCGALVEKHTSETNFAALMEALRQHQQNQTALKTKDGKQFTITNVSESSIQVQPQDALNPKSVNVNYLRAYIESRDDSAIANHSPAYIRGITYEYDRLNSLKPERVNENYVLVIDEINRGNISKIFGELITLIEDSKRSGKGQTELIEVVLPHSGETFSVPNNLYLIGTMNTADRSLAMMDTALRRRFDFVEMMPKPWLLMDCVVKHGEIEINLSKLLTKLNERIEILYDREHTLGHAFFMPVKALVDKGEQAKAFNALVAVFKNKIIPLLEEYFFEDWHKIRLVLADNQKAENSQAEGLQFISEQKLTTAALGNLFGHNHGLNQYGEEQQKFTLKDKTDSVWDNPAAYLGIYSLSQALGD